MRERAKGMGDDANSLLPLRRRFEEIRWAHTAHHQRPARESDRLQLSISLVVPLVGWMTKSDSAPPHWCRLVALALSGYRRDVSFENESR
jgi:hypothetical protein